MLSNKLIQLNDGNKMPMIGLGTWQLQKNHYNTLLNAFKLGYTSIDCAQLYDNEGCIGDALKQLFRQNGIERESLFITSKIWATHQYPHLIIPTLKQQLKSLQIDYIDLYLIHGPIIYKYDKTTFFPTDPETNQRLYPKQNVTFLDTWKQMEKAKKLGLVKSIGVSNFSKDQIQRILNTCSVKPAVNQCEFHPYIYLQQMELVKYCTSKNIIFQGYSPFGCAEKDGPLFDNHIALIAQKYKKTVPQILIRFCIQNNIPTIPKASRFDHLRDNMNVNDFNLCIEDMNKLKSLSRNWRHVWNEKDKHHNEYPFKAITLSKL